MRRIAAALTLALAAVLAACAPHHYMLAPKPAAPAAAIAKTPGVGFPVPADLPAGWRAGWCPQVRHRPAGAALAQSIGEIPFVRSSSLPPPLRQSRVPRAGAMLAPQSQAAAWPGHPDAIAAGFDWSAHCPSGWLGWFAEFFPRTEDMLRGCWELDRWGTLSSHSGQYTIREFEAAEVYTGQRDELYRVCWYERFAEGGSAARAHLIDDSNVLLNPELVDAMKASGNWPKFGEVGSFSGWAFAPNRWPVWVKNMVRNEAPPSPPPPPPVDPVEPVDPPPGPTCKAIPPPPPAPSARVVNTIAKAPTWVFTKPRLLAEVAAWYRELEAWRAKYYPAADSTGRLEMKLREKG